ncbi:hypothetical protein HELRODRAFT_169996 [Helobdella robusta]|uniref:Endonuclease/exonuclease/phosphatase domain-containing protein n=1 Tax=Helobdella robusta TaxID=6412 RepID=T1F2I4_HELRO|nr:hypothetical protein HELRODRAFT_169996 [Helobdella robusta]ESO07470.1 hypothetical protein HELRODRAFT_169996 [Helobdella robusta]
MSKTRSQRSQSIPEPASVKDDNILCCVCDAVVQIESSDLYDELAKYASKSKNMKFYCDNCVKHADGFKGLLQMLNKKFESIDSRLKTFDSIDIGMKNLQLMLESSDENLKQLEKLDEKLNQSINSLKNDITKSWSDVVKSNSKIVDNEAASLRNMISTSFSDVVKKNLDVVSKEVISVRRTIEVANEVKARENNIVLFNFSEDLDVAKDRGNVLSFLRFLTDESLKDDDILKIFRQRKKPSVSSPSRPVIVKFINLSAKVLVMRRLFRLAMLDEKMREVRISDDLTTDQRLQLKKLVLEAKTRESKDVYRPGSVPITPAFFDEFTSLLEQISLLADYVILTGDLNVHWKRVKETTHVHGGILDLVVSSMELPVSSCTVGPYGIYSDHGLVQSVRYYHYVVLILVSVVVRLVDYCVEFLYITSNLCG